MNFDRLIANGRIATPARIVTADIALAGEKIVAIQPGLAELHPGIPVLDASGHLVLPGIIDVHVHLDLPVGETVTADDYLSGTRAAARGGVTTLIDFATPYGEESMSEGIDNWHRRAEGKAMVDYAFHATLTDWERHRGEIKSLIQRGIPTFKEYMIYDALRVDDATLFKSMEAMREYGGRLLVHAESHGILEALIPRHHTPDLMKQHGARLHALTRPNVVEAEAVCRLLHYCQATEGPLYIVHVSTKESADLIQAARERNLPAHAETCIHFLTFDESVFERPDGHLFATCPQVKTPEDQERLWQGVRDGEFSVVSTDTCTFTRWQKDQWQGDFTRIPMGLPGLETLLPVLYTRGVLEGRIPLETLVERLCFNPAKLMGLYPRKGAIEVGADADLILLDPEKRTTVDPVHQETRADWSPFDGWSLAGFPRTVLSRGEIVVDDYKVIGKAGRGQWVPRTLALSDSP
jgi:dihydropyrimidinase